MSGRLCGVAITSREQFAASFPHCCYTLHSLKRERSRIMSGRVLVSGRLCRVIFTSQERKQGACPLHRCALPPPPPRVVLRPQRHFPSELAKAFF
ncbi:hypothetical protein NDU88_005274 [Pleurodeles waltl]|uniref:Uncharacterized protein n=1 Tax=Pleurodeles waltl TaxID=8319 RepID=A0AAV7NNJ0_PLEWA|nr:hypothetical protein NDU88_005274 [Pleurodeles waltl]